MAFKFVRQPEDLTAAHEINVTPFIDVMLVLLVIFMVTAPLSTAYVPLELPASAAAAPAPAHDPVVVSVGAGLQLFVDDTPVQRTQLRVVLERLTQGSRTERVFLRADRNVKYSDLMDVMDLLRAAGYVKVALVTRAKEPAATQ